MSQPSTGDGIGTVFISYSHDSLSHKRIVLALSDKLRSDGIDCVLDQYETSPPEGWPRWMDREIQSAEFVLMICTEPYYRRAVAKEEAGVGHGVAWESGLIYQHIYNAASNNTKFIPVLMRHEHTKYIPAPLQGATRYCISAADGYDQLYNRLVRRPPAERPPLGKRRALPEKDVKPDATTLGMEPIPDLIAIGPNIVFAGEFLGSGEGEWSFHLGNFVDGDVHALLAFIDRYEKTTAIDRYVLVDSLGDGRALQGAPCMTKDKTTGGYIVRCQVLPSADRIRAADLPKSFALSGSHDHDLMLQHGNIAIVSGLDALPQQVKTCLSHQKGESPLHRDFGTRFAEYYRLLRGSPLFERFLKLEVIRQAAIPYIDSTNNRQYTPLLCVERVFGIEILADAPTKNWLPIRVNLDVKGVGRWKHELSVCVPQEPIRRLSFDDILAGPSDS
jgi:TIR domain